MSEPRPDDSADPYRYVSIWGVRVSHRAFDALVARQLLWLPYARPAVRKFFFTEQEEPICPACSETVVPGTPSVVGVAVLADPSLRERIDQYPQALMALLGSTPTSSEAWWLLHGDCFDGLTSERKAALDQRVELTLRADTMLN